MTLWAGRFSAGMSEALWNLSESFSFDAVLYDHDITGSIAHVRGLAHVGLMSESDAVTLVEALETIREEFASDTFVRASGDEDIHMAIERRATELVGEIGRRIHTGRSRNDQVATTLRLYTRDALDAIAQATLGLVEQLLAVADANADVVLPAYTHLQRAQAVLASHHVQAHAFALLRDVDRVLDARARMNISPLGAGAVAGTSLPLDPAFTARELNFDASFANSMDATSDRDFVAEALFTIALLGVHLSRMGEELVLWTSSEFGFATLGDNFTTGSSMLPQKKNSDVAELARGKSGRLVGNLTALLVTLKGLPLAYNRDLQEDKEPLFDSVRTALLVLEALRGAYESLEFNAARTALAAGDELLVAIDIAEALVVEGVPFRDAHELVGRLVGDSVANNTSLRDLVAADEKLAVHVHLFDEGAALSNRKSPGSAGPSAAPAQRERLVSSIALLRKKMSEIA